MFWKICEKKNFVFKWFFDKFETILLHKFSVLIYLRKVFEKCSKTENNVFKWISSNFELFFYSDFLFLFIQEDFLRNLWTLKIFQVLSSYFVTQAIFRSYSLTKIFGKFMKRENTAFKWFFYNFSLCFYPDFSFLDIHTNILKFFENINYYIWNN